MAQIIRLRREEVKENVSPSTNPTPPELYREKHRAYLKSVGLDLDRDWYEWSEIPEDAESGDICFLNVGESKGDDGGNKLSVAEPIVRPGNYPPEVKPHLNRY